MQLDDNIMALVLCLLLAILIASLVGAVTDPPTPQEFREASEDVYTPCYYFCGPWYTWLVTWVLAIPIGLTIILSLRNRLNSRSRA